MNRRELVQVPRLCADAAAETAAGPCTRGQCRYAVEGGPRCALVLADAHPDGMTLDQVGAALGVTRERARQIEAKALLHIASPSGLRLTPAVGELGEGRRAAPKREPARTTVPTFAGLDDWRTESEAP